MNFEEALAKLTALPGYDLTFQYKGDVTKATPGKGIGNPGTVEYLGQKVGVQLVTFPDSDSSEGPGRAFDKKVNVDAVAETMEEAEHAAVVKAITYLGL